MGFGDLGFWVWDLGFRDDGFRVISYDDRREGLEGLVSPREIPQAQTRLSLSSLAFCGLACSDVGMVLSGCIVASGRVD